MWTPVLGFKWPEATYVPVPFLLPLFLPLERMTSQRAKALLAHKAGQVNSPPKARACLLHRRVPSLFSPGPRDHGGCTLLAVVLFSMLSPSHGQSLPCGDKSAVTLPGSLTSLLLTGEPPEGQPALQEQRLL